MLNQLLDLVRQFAERGLDLVRAREHTLLRHQLRHFE
jgi:hypothetical protein